MATLAPVKKSKATPTAVATTLPCGRKLPANLVLTKEQRPDYVAQLRQHTESAGLNRSESREKLLEVISRQVKHFTALQLLKEAQVRFPEIGISTVYRNLPVFVEAKILRESLADESGQVVYELESGHHHDHIVCLDCHAIIEFHEPEIESLQTTVLKKLHFTEDRHRHIVYAHCDQLKRK